MKVKRIYTKYKIELDAPCKKKYWMFIRNYMKEFNVNVENYSCNFEKPYTHIKWFEMRDMGSWPAEFVEEMINKLIKALDEEIKNESA